MVDSPVFDDDVGRPHVAIQGEADAAAVAPSLGTWKRSEAGIVFQRIEYQFAAGVLVRTVNVLAAAEINGDSMSGTFIGLVAGSFFRSGTFTATRVPAKGP